jgi:serine/threonine protein kinase
MQTHPPDQEATHHAQTVSAPAAETVSRAFEILQQYNECRAKEFFRGPGSSLSLGCYVSDHLQLCRRLGTGASGEVWEAVDWRTQTLIAVKCMGVMSSSLQGLFLAEVDRMTRLSHPHVCAVLGASVTPAGTFLRMQCLQPTTLHDELKALIESAETMAHPRAYRLIEEILMGLVALHEADGGPLLHCDLKPRNIGFDVLGRTMLLDVALPAPWFGSPGWEAPEQLAGEVHGAATDLFGVGLVAALLLSGAHPFNDATRLLTLAECHERGPQGLNNLAPAIRTWLERLLATESASRFQSAAEALAEFRAIPNVADDHFSQASGTSLFPPRHS